MNFLSIAIDKSYRNNGLGSIILTKIQDYLLSFVISKKNLTSINMALNSSIASGDVPSSCGSKKI